MIINFLKYRWFCIGTSSAIILAFMAGYVMKEIREGFGKGFEYSIDFTGGTQVMFHVSKPVSGTEVQDVLEKAGWPKAIIRDIPKENKILVRVKEFTNDAKGLGGRMLDALVAAYPSNEIKMVQSEGVGQSIGAVLRWRSMLAILISLLAILIYIGLRFRSLAFALGAVLALFHDAMIVLAVFFFFHREISISVIGAILAILGYSVNDTIVIFSQIRNNLRTMYGVPLAEIVNKSINQTLRRTVLTSVATLLTVLAMLFLGGDALRDFSLALVVGIVAGTYSSIYIASPIMMWFYKGKE